MENLNGSIKSAVSENPMFGANSAAVVFVQAELFLVKIAQFLLPWQQRSALGKFEWYG